jgi:hypothetical protein
LCLSIEKEEREGGWEGGRGVSMVCPHTRPSLRDFFLFTGEEPISETVITDVYKDPLEFCMEGIEEMARKILRTGKLAISGEPGGKWV